MDYKLLLKYTDFYDYATIGELWIWKLKDNSFPYRFFTIQPPLLKDNKINHLIPVGSYPILWGHMEKDNKNHYELQKVPGHEGIFIHCGNKVEDTNGCILAGQRLVLPCFGGHYELENSLFAVKLMENILEEAPSEITIYQQNQS